MTKEMYEDLLERNKLQISELNTLTEEQDHHIVELEKENAELKDKLETVISVGNTCLNDLNKQLTKAKEIIKKFSEFVNNGVEFDPEHPQEHTDLWNELCEKAKQFISEVEK